ncbi:hypothetical protein ACUTG4_24315, partial [Escherichia coli]
MPANLYIYETFYSISYPYGKIGECFYYFISHFEFLKYKNYFNILVLIVLNYGTVAKLAMRQPFVLFKGLTFQKLCLPGAFRPGDHHNKMLR